MHGGHQRAGVLGHLRLQPLVGRIRRGQGAGQQRTHLPARFCRCGARRLQLPQHLQRVGLAPVALNATLDLPFNLRSGVISVTQDTQLISKVGLPLADLARMLSRSKNSGKALVGTGWPLMVSFLFL